MQQKKTPLQSLKFRQVMFKQIIKKRQEKDQLLKAL